MEEVKSGIGLFGSGSKTLPIRRDLGGGDIDGSK